MDNRSKPYFFSFDTKSKPGTMIAHCVRVETVEMPMTDCDQTQFTIFPADFDDDKRLRELCKSAHGFLVNNKIDPKSL